MRVVPPPGSSPKNCRSLGSLNGKGVTRAPPGTTTVRSVSIVTTAGPVRLTASATND